MQILLAFFIAVVVIEITSLVILLVALKKLGYLKNMLFKTRMLVLEVKKDFSGRLEAGKLASICFQKGLELLNKKTPWWLKIVFWLLRQFLKNKTLNQLKTR